MRIRLATEKDIEGIARVHVESWRSTYQGIISESVLSNLTMEGRIKKWAQIFERGQSDSVIYVLEDEDGMINGFFHGGKSRQPELGYDAELYTIYLLQEVQGLGYGRRLFDTFVDALKHWNYCSCMVWVLADNPSLPFYKKLGGQVISSKEIKIGEELHTEVALGWGKDEEA
ncbi:GNAT family N-acetyltransferase [Paenibacillus terrigena]|uniref:GNAT family N-acetyltransferase n=1 Tax=Paenibacillus terrigena TaxID=369333 RepID=UPI0028D71F89|nr:GNAT family N-acetyltransferase [Paenibacillus terrigena]